MRLWTFALAAWRRPGVEAACLELQEAFGQQAPLMLWRLWTLAERRPIGEPELSAAVAAARAWQDQVIEPLRQARRTLKSPPAPFDAESCRPLRAKVMAAEVAAERRLLAALEALSPRPVGGDAPGAAEALEALSRAWGRPVPSARLARLADLF